MTTNAVGGGLACAVVWRSNDLDTRRCGQNRRLEVDMVVEVEVEVEASRVGRPRVTPAGCGIGAHVTERREGLAWS
jgi:hypothetical protein